MVKKTNKKKTETKKVTKPKVSKPKVSEIINPKPNSTELPDTKSKPLDITPKKFKNILKYKKYEKNVYERLLIHIRLNNGYRHMRIVYINKADFFVYNSKVYLVDKDYMYYNPDMNIYCLDYHENISVPLDTSVVLDDILDTIKTNSDISNIVHSLNPQLLSDFQESTVIEKLLKGDQIDNALSQIKKLIIFCLLLAGIGAIGALRLLGVF